MMDFVDKTILEMKPVDPLPLEGNPFKLVEEINDLKDLAAKLSSVEEFAVNTFTFLFLSFFFFDKKMCNALLKLALLGGGCKV